MPESRASFFTSGLRRPDRKESAAEFRVNTATTPAFLKTMDPEADRRLRTVSVAVLDPEVLEKQREEAYDRETQLQVQVLKQVLGSTKEQHEKSMKEMDVHSIAAADRDALRRLLIESPELNKILVYLIITIN